MKLIYLFPQIGRLVKWKWFVPLNPTVAEFEEAWKIIFEYPLKDCRILNVYSDDLNGGFEVETPTASISHGGFGYHTDSPILDDTKDLFYKGVGCTWGRDKEGNRFYKLDSWSYMPVDWDEAWAIEVIRNFKLTSCLQKINQ